MANIKHERADSPSNKIVQAPQTPCSQPTWVPVSPSPWRRKSLNNRRGSTWRLYSFSLTVIVMEMDWVIEAFPPPAGLPGAKLSSSKHSPNAFEILVMCEYFQMD